VTLDSLTSAAAEETGEIGPAVAHGRDAGALLPKNDKTTALKTVRRPAVVRGNMPEFSD